MNFDQKHMVCNHHHNQDTVILSPPPPQIPQCCASVVTLCPHAVPMCLQAFNDLFSVPIILSFPESHINRILMYIASECTFFH